MEGGAMNLDELIPASWFYVSDNEKVKFNWFLYEYAGKLFETITSSRMKAIKKWRSRQSNEQLAEFCAYLAKRMRQSVYDAQEGKEEGVVFLDRYISDYCHTGTLAEINAVMDIAGKAWENLLRSCSACPTGCLDEPDGYCEMFDRMERGGYFA